MVIPYRVNRIKREQVPLFLFWAEVEYKVGRSLRLRLAPLLFDKSKIQQRFRIKKFIL